jgi:hypothetical protein
MPAAEAVRAAPTRREKLAGNANVCGEFVFLVAWNGTGLAGFVNRPVRRVAAQEDKTLACISAITDHSTSEQRVAFLQKVRRTFETW